MLPIHLDLGFTQIYFYEGIYFLISIVLGVWWAKVRVEKYGGKVEKFEGLIVWSIVGALIGARLSHYIFWQSDAFFENPGILFSPTGAGNSITGGLVGGMLGGYFYVKRNNMNYWEYFSLLSPGVLLGQAVGRVGCFLNGDAYGTATSSFLGVQFPRYATTIPDFETEYRLSSPAWQSTQGLPGQTEALSAPVHPTQLYEMFGDVVLILIILWVFKKIWDSDKKSPLIFFIHTGGYALLRWGLEYIRADKEGITMFGMSNLQIVLLLYGLFTIGYAARYYLNKKIKSEELMAEAISIMGLVKSYDDNIVLKELDLSIPKGSIFGLIGPNGAGKSTLIGVLTGLLSFDEGYITIDEMRFIDENEEAIKKEIASVLQPPLLFEQFTSIEFIEYVCDIYEVEKTGLIEKAYSLMDFFEIKDFAKTKIHKLSSGSRKKLAFVTAVLTEPKVLLLDEPFEAVDVISIERMKTVLRKLKAKGVTMIITSHILEVVENLCDDIAILHQGRIIAYLDSISRKSLKEHSTLHEIFSEYVKVEGKDDIVDWL